MTSQPWRQTIAVHILPNILRNKGNQEIKFGQLKEYNMRKLFQKNPLKNEMEKLFPDLFLKNQN